MKNLEAAIEAGAQLIQNTWKGVVSGAVKVPGVDKITSNEGLKKLYLDSIVRGDRLNLPDIGFFRHTVLATHRIAEDLENGRPAFDMKPMLLNGPKARVSKKGKKYTTVPFRHGTPTAAAHLNPMPRDIYREAKQLAASAMSGGKGGRLTGTEGRYAPGVHRFTKPGGAAAEYRHKAGPYEGMVRVQETYEKATQSKYLTFRRVSDNSDPNAWWHPGNEPRGIAKGVENYCRPIIEQSLREAAEADLVDFDTLSVGIRIERR